MREMESFLKGIEKRAFRMAQLATHSEADALDIVQETMIKMVSNYSQKPSNEWKPLFLKILENRILDWHRKQKVMGKIFFWRKENHGITGQEKTYVEIEDVQVNPEAEMISEQLGHHLLRCIESLPIQQQQCFVLRSWEGLSIKETAEIMKLNENSVKTHYSRALAKLKHQQQLLEVE